MSLPGAERRSNLCYATSLPGSGATKLSLLRNVIARERSDEAIFVAQRHLEFGISDVLKFGIWNFKIIRQFKIFVSVISAIIRCISFIRVLSFDRLRKYFYSIFANCVPSPSLGHKNKFYLFFLANFPSKVTNNGSDSLQI